MVIHPGPPAAASATTEELAQELKRLVPEEQPYAYHERLSKGPVHVPRRDREARGVASEMVVAIRAGH